MREEAVDNWPALANATGREERTPFNISAIRHLPQRVHTVAADYVKASQQASVDASMMPFESMSANVCACARMRTYTTAEEDDCEVRSARTNNSCVHRLAH